MGDQQMFAEWLEENTDNFLEMYDKKDHLDEPEALVEIGKFNPSLYYLLIQDKKDIEVFKEISQVRFASNLILFAASAFIVFDTVQTTRSVAKNLSKVANVVTKVTTKVATTGEGIVEIGPTAQKLYKKPGSVKKIYSNLEVAVEAGMKLSEGKKDLYMRIIGYRIVELEKSLANFKKVDLLWFHKQERERVVLRFWETYYKSLFK